MYRIIQKLFPTAYFFFVLFAVLSPLEAQKTNRTIDPEIRAAFTKARIPVLRTGSPAPDFSASRLNGTQVRLGSLMGKVIFLNFWATWCPPCREEMPSMEALYQRFRNRDIEFLAVDIQENRNRVSAFMEQFGLTFPALMDVTGRISTQYGIRSIPTTFIIDRNGNIIASVIGGRDWNTPEVAAALELLLAYDR
ncbi:MAG: TlpA family protein disulfide reductase [Treponema sp.]|jgi:peroxiredoxin|nr:TlpA family protein disulfide reductase [Treponema sp.]